ncbi:MAG: ribonuclease P protein component [Pseudomonadota bacterium]
MRRRAARARLGLGPQHRLRGSGAFEALLRQGRRSTRQGFVFYTVRREAGPPRLGILVSRRHAAKATVRNQIKRCIREAFRLEQARLGALDVLVRPPYGMKPGPEALARLRALFSELAR